MRPLGIPQFIDVAGTTVHWVEVGRGRPVVLLHGLADSHRTWREVATRLPVEPYRLLLPDLPGHGRSARPDASYSLDWHAHIMGLWIDMLQLDQFDVVGHSFGGGLAQALLRTHASRVGRMALVAPGGWGEEVSWGVRLLTLPGAALVTQPLLCWGTQIALQFSDSRGQDPEERAHLAWMNGRPGTARGIARTARGIADLGGQKKHFLDHADSIPHLPPISMFWGSRDPIIPAAHGFKIMQALRDVELTLFQGCGHFPHIERPVHFSDALAAFLTNRRVRPARVVVPINVPPKKRPRKSWWRRVVNGLNALARSVFSRPRPA